MPDVGEGLTEAEILTWYVKPGDTVTDGQVVCEVETAKAAVELPIPYDGVVHELHHPEGATVDVGRPIISVATAAAAPVAAAAPAAPSAPAREPVLVGYGVSEGPTRRRPRKQGAAVTAVPEREPRPTTAPAPEPPVVASVEPAVVEPVGAEPAAAPARPLAKPPVRKLAKDLGVDLATVTPTGLDGIISREDVHRAAAPAPQPEPEQRFTVPERTPAPDPAAAPVAEASGGARVTRIPVKGVRRATARAMVASAFSAPHVTEFVTVDVTRTMKLVEELRSDPDMAGLRVTPLLLVAKALLVAIKRNPEINASWDEMNQEIVIRHDVNLGIAAATPRGLIVPNIKDAHIKTLPRLAGDLGELVAAAKEGKTPPSAMADGTVTITNVGVFGVDTGTPILNPGEAAILAVGAIRRRPWVHKGKMKPRQVTTLALSFDHRLVDGELGSKVLADVAGLLEQPKRFLTWG
ncbi:dihydrolipoamide acetyltransferase family protein [Streptomyces sp. TLI_105]|uniref:dihydrolipoamide acetyltransferase family protein n=1 Tax=Streptomyces sp. TLI_105 TaxID=1881019 RepID=UPI000B869E42|nr:dihydrolipoamide acetyltransferase family protein [Streptomyces sp. TLI_105]